MMNIKTVLMLSVSCLTFMAAKDVHANLNYNINSVESNLDTKHIYTHAHLSTKHLSSAFLSIEEISNFPKVAAVCFVPDLDDPVKRELCKGMRFESPDVPMIPPTPEENCSSLGYSKTSCETGCTPKGYCPYDNKYFKECVCPECPTGYQSNLCANGQLNKGSQVVNGKTCYKCVDCDDTCPEGFSTKGTGPRGSNTECGNSCFIDCSCEGGYTSKWEAGDKCGRAGYYSNSKGYCYPCYKCNICAECEGFTTYPSGKECPNGVNIREICGVSCFTCRPCPEKCEYSSYPSKEDCPGGVISYDSCGTTCYRCKTCSVVNCNYTAETQPDGWDCSLCTSVDSNCVKTSGLYSCTPPCLNSVVNCNYTAETKPDGWDCSPCTSVDSNCVKTSGLYSCTPPCLDDCSGYKTRPTSSQCPYGYDIGRTACGNSCYTCKVCSTAACEYTSSNKPIGPGWSCKACTETASDCSVISVGYNCTYALSSCDKPNTISDCSYKGYYPRYDGGDVMRKDEYVFCCDNSDPICTEFARPCSEFTSKCSGTLNLVRNVTCCGGYNRYSMRKCE